jgi:two-component system, NtrC family, sensor histidine kinase HydH
VQHKKFDIRIWFVLTSIVAIVVINTVIALVLSRFLVDRILLREGTVAGEFMHSILAAENSIDKLFAQPSPSPELMSFVDHVKFLPGVLRANIYAPDGTIVFSTEKSLQGQRITDSEDLQESLTGKISTGLEEVSEVDKSENMILLPGTGTAVIESYIPLSRPGGPVFAVVEFYKSPAELHQVTSALRNIVWMGAGLGGLLLFSVLYSAIARGARLIEQQKTEIRNMAIPAALGQMASAVAHSLRNPLANIQSTAELMALQHPHETRSASEDIKGEVERMNQHVSELLDFARSEHPEGERTDITLSIIKTIRQHVHAFARSNIDLAFEVPQQQLEVVVDIRMLSQAVNNIISNAIEAMPGGGKLTVLVGNSQHAKHVVIRISDTGSGIPRELLKRMPEAFQTTKTRGLGLGLHLTKQLVERFDGVLTIESTVGQGTTVQLEFPKAA